MVEIEKCITDFLISTRPADLYSFLIAIGQVNFFIPWKYSCNKMSLVFGLWNHNSLILPFFVDGRRYWFRFHSGRDLEL